MAQQLQIEPFLVYLSMFPDPFFSIAMFLGLLCMLSISIERCDFAATHVSKKQ